MSCGSFSDRFLSISEHSSQDECLLALREIIDFVPENLRADVMRPFFNEELQDLRTRIMTAVATSNTVCRHAGIMTLVGFNHQVDYSAAIHKTPVAYHDLLLWMIQSAKAEYSIVKLHLSHFLEETISLGFVRAALSLMDFSSETEVRQMFKHHAPQMNPTAEQYAEFLVSVLTGAYQTNVSIRAAKWLPSFVVTASEKLKAVAMLQSHENPHVKCIGVFHAIAMSNNEEISGYQVPTKMLCRALLTPSFDIETRTDMEGFHGSIGRVAVRIVSREIEDNDSAHELCSTISEKWRAQTVSTVPSNRELVEKNIRRLYQAASAQPPKKIIWFSNPLLAAEAAQKYSKTLGVDSSRKTTATNSRYYYGHLEQWSSVEAFYVRLEWLIDELPLPRDWTDHWRWHQRRSNSHDIYNFVVGNDDWLRDDRNDQFLLRLVNKKRLRTIGIRSLLQKLDMCFDTNDGLEEILLNCGGFFAFEKVAFVVERPSKIHRDASKRIHCSSGKAVEYSDGWGCYVWKNVGVPEELILCPEELTRERIDNQSDPDLRWAMIDIYGTRRYVEESELQPTDESEYGTLYLLKSSNRPHLAFLRVQDATPETDGSNKEYYMSVPVVETAKAAVAWTFSMEAAEYNPLVET